MLLPETPARYARLLAVLAALAAVFVFVPVGAGEEKPALSPEKAVDGRFYFPFEQDFDYDGHPDRWVRRFDDTRLPRVKSGLESPLKTEGKALVFRLNSGPAEIRTRRFLAIDWRITYRLELDVMTVNLEESTAYGEVEFFDKDFKPLDKYAARTEEVGGTTGKFRTLYAIVEDLGRRVKYARISLHVKSSLTPPSGDFDRKNRPVTAAFDRVILREFPRTRIKGERIFYVGEKAPLSIVTSILKPGLYKTEEDYTNYRGYTDRTRLNIRSFTLEEPDRYEFEVNLKTGEPGYFVYRHSIWDASGKLVTRGETPYVVLERMGSVQSRDFGVGLDPSIPPDKIERYLEFLGLGTICLDVERRPDPDAHQTLRKLFRYTIPGVEKVGRVNVPADAAASDEKARLRLGEALAQMDNLAESYSDELSSWMLESSDASLFARRDAGDFLSRVVGPIKAIKSLARVGLSIPASVPRTDIPDGFDYRMKRIRDLDNLHDATPDKAGCEWVMASLPDYDSSHHHEHVAVASRAIISLKAGGFEKILIEHLSGEQSGLLSGRLDPRPAFVAYRKLVHLLDRAKRVDLVDPATGEPYTVHPDARTVIFKTPSGYLLAAWTDGRKIEAEAYLGSDLVRHDLLGRSDPMKLDAGRAMMKLSSMPVVISGVDMQLLKFHLNIRFLSKKVPCRLGPQEITFGFTNFFDNAFDGTFKLEFPPRWRAEPLTFSFRDVAPGQSRNASLTVSVPQQATIETKNVGFDVTIYMPDKDDPAVKNAYQLKVKRPLTLSSALASELVYLVDQKSLRVRVINRDTFQTDVYVYITVDGMNTIERMVTVPPRSEKTGKNGKFDFKIPLPLDKPSGRKVRIGLREGQGGTRFYNDEYAIP